MTRFASFVARIAPVLRVLAGGVLAVSGYLKAVRPSAEFAASLESYWLLPGSMIGVVSRVVPWVELGVGVALLTGWMVRSAALAGAGLYAAFVVVLSQAMVRKLSLTDCGCFGQAGPHLQPAQALAMDAVLLIVCLLVFFDTEKRMTLDRWIDQP